MTGPDSGQRREREGGTSRGPQESSGERSEAMKLRLAVREAQRG